MNKVALKDLCKPNEIGKYGIPAPAEEYSPDKTRYLRISDIDDVGNLLDSDKKSVSSKGIGKYILGENDIVFARTGNSTGRTFFYEEKYGTLAYAGFLIRYGLDEGKVNPKYLKYFTISNEYRKWIKNLSVGSTRGNINARTFSDCPILLPNRRQQDLLVTILSSLDDKIELNNRINAELEAMAKTLYDYWFVQFDFPDKNGKPYKSSGGKMVYNEVLKREIPEGWEVNVFGDWVKETKVGDWGKETEEGNYTERVFCIRGADINGLNGKGEIKAPERFILKKNTSKALKPNDFIIEISGGSPTQSTARIALLTEKTLERFDTKVICSNFCKAVSLKDKQYIFNFRQEWQRLYNAGIFFGFEGKTSGIKNFLFDSFMSSYYVTYPKREVVEKYYAYAKLLEGKKQSNLQQNQELAQLRDWLLPMLMNGQVKVAKAYKPIKGDMQLAAEPEPVYAKAVQLNIPGNRKPFAKQVLAGKIVTKFQNDPNFTDIKFQKIQFLAEHIIEADLNLNYYYQVAGPYDNKFMHTIYDNFRKQKWFDCRNGKIVPLEKQGKIETYYRGYFEPAEATLNRLFNLLHGTTEAQAEIIATLYAVWNNRIIEGKPVTDDDLITEFYNWSKRKRQYSERQVEEGLQWLRDNQMGPTGFGKLIKKAKGKNK